TWRRRGRVDDPPGGRPESVRADQRVTLRRGAVGESRQYSAVGSLSSDESFAVLDPDAAADGLVPQHRVQVRAGDRLVLRTVRQWAAEPELGQPFAVHLHDHRRSVEAALAYLLGQP